MPDGAPSLLDEARGSIAILPAQMETKMETKTIFFNPLVDGPIVVQ